MKKVAYIAALCVIISVLLATTACTPAAPGGGGPKARLAFISTKDGTPDLYTVNSDGANLNRLTNSADRKQAPHWSPDGTRLAYLVAGSNATGTDVYTLYVVDSNGANNHAVSKLPVYDIVNWLPNGKMVAITRSVKQTGALPQFNLRLIDISTGDEIDIATGTLGGIDWASDSSKVVFSDVTYSGTKFSNFVKTSPVVQPSPKQILDSTTGAPRCKWSPDGTKIACVEALSATDGRVFVVNADGSDLKQIAKAPPETTLMWSADGKRVAYDRFSVNSDGSDSQALGGDGKVDTYTADELSPDWKYAMVVKGGGGQVSAEIWDQGGNLVEKATLQGATPIGFDAIWSK